MGGDRSAGTEGRGAATLQGRIAAAALGTAMAVLLVASAVFAYELREMDARSLRTQARDFATVLAARAPSVMGDRQTAQADLASLSGAPSIRGAILFDDKGEPIAAYTLKAGMYVATATVVEARAPVRKDGRVIGEVVIRAASHRFDPLFIGSMAVCAALFFGAAGAALFLGRWLAGRVVGPVNRLSRAMAEVSESGDFTRLVPGVGADELGRLTASFNELLLRLQSNDRELRRTFSDLSEARDAAEAANVQKSQFLANMSHEIRTPLNGVLAMTQAMALGDLTPVQRSRLDVVRQSGEALLTVLNDVLDVSKIEAGKLMLEPVELDVAETARLASDAFAVLAEAKGLDLTLNIEPEAEGLRLADPLRLRQVLANLVSNAVKFTETGAVRMSVRGDGLGGEAGVRITVSDTGIGVDSHRLPQLFDKFIQGDSSTTRRFGGTGLGLSICRDLVELMGGAIWAESELGKGSSFHIVLPMPRIGCPVAAAAPVPAPAAAEPRPTATLRVLAAEDNPTNQLVLSTIMEVFGIGIEIVADGREAVAAWRRGGFDLILMDIQMPHMDGVEATRAIREIEQAEGRRRTPIVALSANAMTHQVRDYLAAGMDAHVAKPIELNRLQSAMEEALAEAQAAQAAA